MLLLFDSLIIILFNDGHVRSETVALCRRMSMVLDDSDGQMMPGTNVAQISWHLSCSWGKLPEKPQAGSWSDRESNPGPLRERQRCYAYITTVICFFFVMFVELKSKSKKGKLTEVQMWSSLFLVVGLVRSYFSCYTSHSNIYNTRAMSATRLFFIKYYVLYILSNFLL